MVQFLIDPHTNLGSICLRVSNLERSLEFYHLFLGLKIISQTADRVLLSVNDNMPYIIELHQAEQSNHTGPRAGLYHFAILLPSRAELASFASLVLLHQDRLKIDGCSDHLVSEAIYIRDPDNNGIEIYRDRPQSEWIWEDGSVQMAVLPLDLKELASQSTGTWSGFAPDTRLGHIHLHVSDLANAKKFYGKIMGFANTASMSGALFFAAGEYHHHIGTNVWLGESIPGASGSGPGLEYFSLVFSSRQKLDELILQLGSCDVMVRKLADNSGYEVADFDNVIMRLLA